MPLYHIISLTTSYKGKSNSKGQSLVEILVSITLAALFSGGAVITMGVALKTSATNKGKNRVNALVNQLAEVLVSTSKGNRHVMYDVTKGNDYQITLSGSIWITSSGQETIYRLRKSIY